MAALTFTAREAKTKQRLSPRFACDQQGPTSSRWYLVGWNDILKTEYEFLGWPERTGVGSLSRNLPQRDPQKQNLWAVRCDTDENLGSKGFEEVEVDGQMVKIQKWNEEKGSVIKVDYSWLPYDIRADDDLDINGEYGRYVEVQEDGQCDILTSAVFSSMFKWAAPGVASVNGVAATGQGINKVIPYSNVCITWHQVPYIYYPRTAIRNAYGKVSKEDLGVPGDRNFYAKGTLLFLACRRRRYAMAHPELTGVGQAVVDLQYYFRHDDGGDLTIHADNFGPNTFPCFLPSTTAANAPPLNRRTLISTTGLFYNIGSRDDVCIFNEFDPRDLFKVE